MQLTTDGLKVYLNAVIDAFADEIEYAVLHKIYGAEPAKEARYPGYDIRAGPIASCMLSALDGQPFF